MNFQNPDKDSLERLLYLFIIIILYFTIQLAEITEKEKSQNINILLFLTFGRKMFMGHPAELVQIQSWKHVNVYVWKFYNNQSTHF